MAEDRWKHWDARRGLVAAGHVPIRQARRALTRSLPTMAHALDLFDRVVGEVGARGWIDPRAVHNAAGSSSGIPSTPNGSFRSR